MRSPEETPYEKYTFTSGGGYVRPEPRLGNGSGQRTARAGQQSQRAGEFHVGRHLGRAEPPQDQPPQDQPPQNVNTPS